MNAIACLTPREIRSLIHSHAQWRDDAALIGDAKGYHYHVARIAELEAMLPERQYEVAA